jgi:hypothetical protein
MIPKHSTSFTDLCFHPVLHPKLRRCLHCPRKSQIKSTSTEELQIGREVKLIKPINIFRLPKPNPGNIQLSRNHKSINDNILNKNQKKLYSLCSLFSRNHFFQPPSKVPWHQNEVRFSERCFTYAYLWFTWSLIAKSWTLLCSFVSSHKNRIWLSSESSRSPS